MAGPSEEVLLVMVSLTSGPKHGYAIADDIEAFAGRRLGAGTLYGAIARLEGRGLIQALAGDARRRPYRLTPLGASALRDVISRSNRLGAVARRRLAMR